MRRRCYLITGLGCLVGAAIALTPGPSAARTCNTSAPMSASQQLREFRVEPFNLALMIPDNYRSMLRSGGHITFHDPRTFELIQCLVRTGEYAEVPPYVALEIHRGINSQSDLVEIVRRKRPWVDFYNPDFELIELGGRVSLQYDYPHEIYPLTIANISFVADDGNTLLTLTGPAEHPILQNVLTTLAAPDPDESAPVDDLDDATEPDLPVLPSGLDALDELQR